jgi:DNA-binding phage protein
MARSHDYRGDLIEELKDPDEALAYLNGALEESAKGDLESQQLLLHALRNVSEAQGGIEKFAFRFRDSV